MGRTEIGDPFFSVEQIGDPFFSVEQIGDPFFSVEQTGTLFFQSSKRGPFFDTISCCFGEKTTPGPLGPSYWVRTWISQEDLTVQVARHDTRIVFTA
jgi:hypothetical protein